MFQFNSIYMFCMITLPNAHTKLNKLISNKLEQFMWKAFSNLMIFQILLLDKNWYLQEKQNKINK